MCMSLFFEVLINTQNTKVGFLHSCCLESVGFGGVNDVGILLAAPTSPAGKQIHVIRVTFVDRKVSSLNNFIYLFTCPLFHFWWGRTQG